MRPTDLVGLQRLVGAHEAGDEEEERQAVPAAGAAARSRPGVDWSATRPVEARFRMGCGRARAVLTIL